jgi:hypothetical protein
MSKFCSLLCCWQWRKDNDANPGGFQPGVPSWNAGTAGKGVMKPNVTSFKKGMESATKVPVGTEKVRREKNGRLRTWVKVSDGAGKYTQDDWKLRSVVVYEKKYGPIPKGGIVHHKDHDPMNDDINNLMLVDRRGHLLIHRPDFENRRCNAASRASRERHQRARLQRAAAAPETVVH